MGRITRLVAAQLLLAVHVGCAPVSTMPPPVPLGEQQTWDLGLAVGTPLLRAPQTPYPEDRFVVLQRSTPQNTSAYPGAQLWAQRQLGSRVGLGATVFGDTGATRVGSGGGGVYARVAVVHRPEFTIGLQASTGWLYLSGGLPVGVRLHEKIWLYSNPTVGFDLRGGVYLPIGLSYAAREDILVHLELSSHSFINQFAGRVEIMPYAALGVSYRPTSSR